MQIISYNCLDLSPFAGVMGLPYVWRGYPFKAPKIKAEADDAAARKA